MTGEKLHSCYKCRKSFSRFDTVVRHQKICKKNVDKSPENVNTIIVMKSVCVKLKKLSATRIQLLTRRAEHDSCKDISSMNDHKNEVEDVVEDFRCCGVRYCES